MRTKISELFSLGANLKGGTSLGRRPLDFSIPIPVTVWRNEVDGIQITSGTPIDHSKFSIGCDVIDTMAFARKRRIQMAADKNVAVMTMTFQRDTNNTPGIFLKCFIIKDADPITHLAKAKTYSRYFTEDFFGELENFIDVIGASGEADSILGKFETALRRGLENNETADQVREVIEDQA